MTDLQLQTGPCIICGKTDYPLSMGGPTICPKCDCGHFDAATVLAQAKVIERLTNERAALRAALIGIAEYCGGDGRPLGAIERLTAIRNTAEQAVRLHEQKACPECIHGLASVNWRDGKPYSYCPECGREEPVEQAGPMLCESCGTLTSSGECDCTRGGTGTQRLVAYEQS